MYCLSCEDPIVGCESCTYNPAKAHKYDCDSCGAGKTFVNEGMLCAKPIENCETYDPTDPELCSSCVTGYGFGETRKECLPCSNSQVSGVANCDQCTTSWSEGSISRTCTSCEGAYTLDGGVCVLAEEPEHCIAYAYPPWNLRILDSRVQVVDQVHPYVEKAFCCKCEPNYYLHVDTGKCIT